MAKIRVFTAEHHNPYFNLATEDWLFRSTDPSEYVLFLWRNQKCIVIGRFQNPWEECNLFAMDRDGVLLARRQSGGGAVYHDLGNTNFTFMSPKQSYSKEENFSIIVDALAKFGITAQTSGRNDIVVDNKKISGSAFRLTSDRAFHHGTLLIDTELGSISEYLTPDKEKLQSKGIKSVASRVANISSFNHEVTHERLCDSIVETFFAKYGVRCEIEELTFERLSAEKELEATYKQYADWKWRFGLTPEFSHIVKHRFAWGGISLHLDVKDGVIKKGYVFSDALDVAFIEQMQPLFAGHLYNGPLLARTIIDSFSDSDEERKNMAAQVADFITKELC
ncbi:MAG: lipoate--protein ligase [Spirochaetales bacterium]|nr:lipoate--protein ligase [Spirochaetales bacterium]